MRRQAVVLLVAVLAATGCGSTTKPHSASRASIDLSSDFNPGAAIPRAYTCDGRDLSPPLRAAGVPSAAKEVVLVMRDHSAPGGDFIHWAIAHIAPQGGSLSLAAGAHATAAVLGRNSFGSLGYRGPCPPAGEPAHHYEITVYALARPSTLKSGFSADAVASLPVLARGSLTGVYARSQSAG
jgi:Raf kinase inhibitor-like YbhB/YbcL family protein